MSDSDTLTMLEELCAAFNAHDLDRIMGLFGEDCVLEMPRGPDAHGTRYIGAPAVREALHGRFAGIPNVSYDDAKHFVSGDTGISKWTLHGTSTNGERLEVNDCDFYTFRNGKVVYKDSYWKIRER